MDEHRHLIRSTETDRESNDRDDDGSDENINNVAGQQPADIQGKYEQIEQNDTQKGYMDPPLLLIILRIEGGKRALEEEDRHAGYGSQEVDDPGGRDHIHPEGTD